MTHEELRPLSAEEAMAVHGGNPAVIGGYILSALAGTILGQAFGPVELPKPKTKVDWKKVARAAAGAAMIP
jgi:hypothetical protein